MNKQAIGSNWRWATKDHADEKSYKRVTYNDYCTLSGIDPNDRTRIPGVNPIYPPVNNDMDIGFGNYVLVDIGKELNV